MARKTDNTLGAPEEGVARNVSFAFDNGSGVPSLEIGSEGRVTAGVQGSPVAGGVASAQSVEGPGPNPTMELLMKVGDEIMKPRIQKAKTEAFVSGMQKAMAGEAVTDIAAQQPWYSKIFGDSDVVEGARAYAGHTVAQTQMAAMEDQMPELRKMEPAAAQKYFQESVNQALTGDAAADQSILKAMTQALPPLMRQQTKQHYGYLQERAATSEAAAFKAGADRLQKGAKSVAGGYTTPEEYAALADGFVRSLVPAAGRDPKNYKESMKDNLSAWASDGNFHALNAVRDRGFFEVLDPDQRAAVEKAVEAGQAKLKHKYSFDWNDDLAKTKAMATRPPTGVTATDIAGRIDTLNSRFMQETGSRQGLIDPETRAAMVSGSAVAIAKEYDRQAELAGKRAEQGATDAEKAAMAALKVQKIDQAIAEGSVTSLLGNKNYATEEVSERVNMQYQTMTPEKQVAMLVNMHREDYVDPVIRKVREGQVNSVLSAGEFTPAAQEIFGAYAKLRDANPATADAYYGKYAAQMEGLYNDQKNDPNNGLVLVGAFNARFINPKARTNLGVKEMKEAVSFVESNENDWMPELLGGVKMQPGQARRMVSESSGFIQQLVDAGVPVKKATQRAMIAAKQQGLETLGGYAWKNNPKTQRPLAEYLNLNAPEGSDEANRRKMAGDAPVPIGDHAGKLVRDAVKELLYGKEGKAGLLSEKTSDIYVHRHPDVAGVPMFEVIAVVDGMPRRGGMSGKDIFDLARRQREAKEKPVFNIKQVESTGGMGPKLTTDIENVPSPYMSTKQRAEWDEKQRQKAAAKVNGNQPRQIDRLIDRQQ